MTEPFAARIRPETLDDIFGQEHILAKDSMLRRMIEADVLSSIVLYGPPGTGKTTIASVIAKMTKCNFEAINATTAGKSDMKKIVDTALDDVEENDTRTILFIDEIHRFNKAQQDFLLPYVENGTIILIGATTENPYFEINNALLSRSQIFELRPLDKWAMYSIIERAISKFNEDSEYLKVEIDKDTEAFLVDVADGDARQVLNALDLAIRTSSTYGGTVLRITLTIAGQCIQKKIRRYDRDGDNHYDTISAFIESMKHSEVDAALYYLARMLDRGEDPKYIARRLVVCATRDIGLANPEALHVAMDAFLAVERIGMPECADALAMSTIVNSMSAKSDTVTKSYAAAMKDVQDYSNVEIPDTLRDESYKSAHKLGHGGVSDVFASPFHYDGFPCMPAGLEDHRYFYPSDMGKEGSYKPYLKWIQEFKENLRGS